MWEAIPLIVEAGASLYSAYNNSQNQKNAGGQGNPANPAMSYLNGIPDTLKQYLNPYIQNGQNAFGPMNNYMNRGDVAGNLALNQYQNLTNNPSSVMNNIGSTFQQSPGYAWQQSQALSAANRAAAAGGMAGSPQEQQQAATVSSQLANQDYYNYLNHGMDLYGQGLSGLSNMEGMGLNAGEDMYNAGYGASDSLASMLGANSMSQANLAYAGQQNKNQAQGGAMGGLLGMLGPLMSMFGGSGGSGGGMGGMGGLFSMFGGASGGGGGGDSSGQLPMPFSGSGS